jgi:hypothetical protein
MVRGGSLLLISLALGALVACGRGYCERSARALEDCGSDPGFWMDQCRQDLKTCSRSDEKLLESFFDCRQEAGVYACEADEGALEDGLGCLAELDGLSEDCVFDEAIAAPAE